MHRNEFLHTNIYRVDNSIVNAYGITAGTTSEKKALEKEVSAIKRYVDLFNLTLTECRLLKYDD